jgi:hypothetical protein
MEGTLSLISLASDIIAMAAAVPSLVDTILRYRNRPDKDT